MPRAMIHRVILLLLSIWVVSSMKTPKCTHNVYIGNMADLAAGKSLGEPVQAAPVYERVVHRWHCDGDDLAGVSFRNCYVSDGETRLADVVDQHGCSTDPILVLNISRSMDQKTTFMETAVPQFMSDVPNLHPEFWLFCEAQTCSEGRCDDVMPMPSCYQTIDPSKEELLLIPSKPLPQPAPTADLETELEEIMRELNGTYQPALIVAGRLHVKMPHPKDKSKVIELQNVDAKSADSAVKAPEAAPNTVIDDEVMEKMTFGRPLSWSGTIVLIVGLGTLIALSACAFFALLYRKFERVIHCGNQKTDYPM